MRFFKHSYLVFVISSFVGLKATAFGSKSPKPAPAPRPTPSPSPSPPPATPPTTPPATPPTTPPGGGVSDDDYFALGRDIDSARNKFELSKSRAPASHVTDSCVLTSSSDTFIEAIGWGVDEAFVESPQELEYLATSSWDPYNIFPTSSAMNVSLQSHAMCRVSSESLQRNMSTSSRAANVPNALTIDRMNAFVDRYNALRTRVLSGDTTAVRDLKNHWARFLGCLAYVESLGDPDVPRSDSLARQFAPDDYSRPQGVNFYYDRGQPVESALNIGLFQFSPGSNGNIQGCIRKWNKKNTSCTIPERASNEEMIRILGSSRQAFNAYCGANAILNTFYVQVNTKNPYRSDASNILSNGSLKRAQDRCVSLHLRSGRSYNHFGPLHNSTGSNLAVLMSCFDTR